MLALSWSKTEDGKEWDNFVAQNHGTAFQSWAWREVAESELQVPHYLALRDPNGTLNAVCPFFQIRQGPYLSALDSNPGAFRGGPLFISNSENILPSMELLRKSVKFSISNRLKFFRMNVYNEDIVSSLLNLGAPYKIYVTLSVLNLKVTSVDNIWTNHFLKRERQNIKYFDRVGCSFRLAERETEYDAFLKLHRQSMERQSYPSLSTDYLNKMRSAFGEDFRIGEVTFPNGDLVAAVSLVFNPSRTMVHLLHVGYSREPNSKSSYSYIIWKVVGWAAANGLEFVDLGGTNPDPSKAIHRVKRKFGARFIPVYTFTIPVKSLLLSLGKKSYALARSVASTIEGRI